MKLKIVSDGHGHLTKVIDMETEEVVANVVKVEWSVEARGLAHATITLVDVPVEVVVQDPRVVWRRPE